MSVELESLITKLNPLCKRALQKAAELCVSLTHYNVEIEHFFLELLKAEDTDLLAILDYYRVDPHMLTQQLSDAIENLKRGNSRTPAMSPQIVSVLQEAWVFSSVHLGHQKIQSGALLVGLFSNQTLRGVVMESAPALMVMTLEDLRNNIHEILKHSGETSPGGVAAAGKNERIGEHADSNSDTPNLEKYTVDITGRAKAGEIDPIEGRDAEIRQVIDILTRRRQNNPILTGDAGVGKTAVAEGFALRVVRGDVPPDLKDISLRALDLGLLQAGAGVKGEFENQLKSVISEVKSSPQPIILFVDEAHTLIGAGGDAGQNDAANLLKPALARGELRTIAATTWAEYKKYFEKDHALVRRFQVVKVEEPDVDTAIEMLQYVAGPLEKHHKVRILDEAVEAAVKLSHKYMSGRKLPDKAISLLDTACARVAVEQNSIPAVIEDKTRTIDKLQHKIKLLERENISTQKYTRRIEELQKMIDAGVQPLEDLKERWEAEQKLTQKILDTRQALETLTEEELWKKEELAETLTALRAEQKQLQAEQPMIHVDVEAETVAAIVSDWTGIPLGKMVADEMETILNLSSIMGKRLIGQNHALEAISRRIRTSRAHLDDPDKPAGVFMLVGPSGVGKTETALTLSEILYGGQDNVITVNMSEYQEAHTVSALKGAPPGYVGYGTGGVLTEAVRRQPFSVVLLDEVEKAHPDVMEVFYQVFDKGSIEDGEGVKIDFKNTIILLTSNIGTDEIAQACRDNEELPVPEQMVELIRPQLLRHFKPAFLGRMVIIPYYQLGDEQIRDIVRLKLNKIKKRFEEHNNATLTFEDSIIDVIGKRCTEVDSGARNIDHILTNSLLPELSERGAV